jgi:anthranilate/para-aminobenzoate synthase component I
MFYFNIPDYDMQVVGASPEMHVRLEDGVASVRPIAGTRWRGKRPPKTQPWPPNCWPIPKSGPSTSCW